MVRVREQSRKHRVVAYVLCVFVVSIGCLAFFVRQWGVPRPVEAVFFWILYAVGDRLSVEGKVAGIPRAGIKARSPVVSAGFMVLMAAAFATDPATAAVIGMATPLIPPWRGSLRSAFNAAQVAIYAGGASAVFFVAQRLMGHAAAGLVLGAVAGSLVGVALNTTLVGGVMALERARPMRGLLREMGWPAVANVPFALIALLIALLYRDGWAAAAVLVLSPLLVLRSARQAKIDLENAQERTLRAFIRAVELKDPYTSRHSERVATIAVQLHRKLGAGEETIQRRYYGALLHDIGKVGVSGRILTKPDRLTDEEIEEVKRHPGTGAFVVAGIEFLADLMPEVLHHHERLDGRGYPSGLRADEIPAQARVLAVADTFEALTSDRPYRAGLSTAEALAEMRRCAGSQLDPVAVEALAAVVADGELAQVLPLRRSEFARVSEPLAVER